MIKPLFVFLSLALVSLLISCNPTTEEQKETLKETKLFVSLPDYCPTPDAFAITQSGEVILSCPNYANKQPGVLIKIKKDKTIVNLGSIPGLNNQGKGRPVGIAIGENDVLYVCDNLGKQNGRLLRVIVENDTIQQIETIASGFELPLGVRAHKGVIYMTQAMMPQMKTKNITSGLYRFVDADRNIQVKNDSTDAHLVFTTQTKNTMRQFGLDGVEIVDENTVLVSDFGDATIFELKISHDGKLLKERLYAQLPDSIGLDGIVMDKRTGNLYGAGFCYNQIFKINPKGEFMLKVQYADNNGANGQLDQPADVMIYEDKLLISNFDLMVAEGMVNTKHDKPYSVSYMELP